MKYMASYVFHFHRSRGSNFLGQVRRGDLEHNGIPVLGSLKTNQVWPHLCPERLSWAKGHGPREEGKVSVGEDSGTHAL